jgi:hypothetical protein
MSDFKEQMVGSMHGKYSNAILYTFFISAFLGNAIPTPSDAYYFYLQTKLRDKWKRGEITASQYWSRNTIFYYGIPCLWWLLLFGIVVNLKISSEQKLKVAIALIGSTALVGVVLKMVQNDKDQLSMEDAEKLKLLKEHPEVVAILNKPEFSNISSQFRNITGEKLKAEYDNLVSQTTKK